MTSVRERIELYLGEKIEIARSFPLAEVERLIEAVWNTYEHDGAVYIFANGGPAGAAEGFATDLKTHPFVSENKHQTADIRRLKVHCLNESCGAITGIANDLGYEFVFTEQLKNHLRSREQNQHDLVIAFSASGNSKNILNGFVYARQFGVTTACLTGRSGGKTRELADICVLIPGSSRFPGQTGANDNNFHIEDFQTSITHMVTGIIKERVMSRYAR